MSSSDRSRTSDDRHYNYKAVVAQQGRVIVDRDVNALESLLIQRADTDILDIVGPAGTPDNGFEISVPSHSPPHHLLSPGSPPAFDFTVGPGTMYVGGQRVELPLRWGGYSYFSQPDWSKPNDPLPTGSPPGFAGSSPPTGIESVWLDVFDQEVSATEDPDLKEVALGGPDTTARVRLMRRIRRTPVQDGGCADAWTDVTQTLSTQLGLGFDADTMRLTPQVRLQVSFQQDPASTDLCDPVARGGFLYSENQLIRVQICAAAAGAAGTAASFLWGYDNASFLYRISSVTNAGTQLQLADSPPDAFHWPKAGQVVEILRTEVVLGKAPDANNPDEQIVRCVAEATGVLRTLSQSYGATTQGGTANYLTFTDPLPQEYLGLDTPLFVRIWQGQQDYPTGAKSVALKDGTNGTTNGVVISLTTPAGVPMTIGAYWLLAFRPGTPQAVYPERFLNSPQPPDGPARWACPLATIDWTTQPPTVTDCRSPFDNLVTLTRRKPGCCTVNIRPESLTGAVTLQKIIDAAAKKADSVKICFAPGVYLLSESLRLGPQHSGIVLEGCTEGAILRADARAPANRFQQGLLVMIDAPGVTLSGLTFQSIDVPVPEIVSRALVILAEIMALEIRSGFQQRNKFQPTPLTANPDLILRRAFSGLFMLIGVRAVWCTNLTVENCSFDVISTSAQDRQQSSIAIGLFLQGNCTGLSVSSCSFTGATGTPTLGLAAIDGQFVPREPRTALRASRPAAPTGVTADGGSAAPVATTAPTPPAGAATPTGTPELLDVLPEKIDFTLGTPAAEAQTPIAAAVGLLVAPWIGGEEKKEEAVNLDFVEAAWLLDARICANTFDSLTYGVATLANTGTLRVLDNTIKRCVAGVWLATWHQKFIEFNLNQPVNQGADQLLYYSLLYLETAVALFVPMFLPVQQQATPRDVQIAVRIAASLLISGNDADCNSAASGSGSMAMAIFDDTVERRLENPLVGTVAITGNRLWSSAPPPYPTLLASLTGTLTVTGNNVSNTAQQVTFASNRSLWVDINGTFDSGGDQTQLGLAVTGNVFHGNTNLSLLPRGQVGAPMDNWDNFNALI